MSFSHHHLAFRKPHMSGQTGAEGVNHSTKHFYPEKKHSKCYKTINYKYLPCPKKQNTFIPRGNSSYFTLAPELLQPESFTSTHIHKNSFHINIINGPLRFSPCSMLTDAGESYVQAQSQFQSFQENTRESRLKTPL